MFNIRDYGAVGDGIQLDSPAIQRAVDACAAAGGGTVFIPAGKYLCGTATDVRMKMEIGSGGVVPRLSPLKSVGKLSLETCL